MRRLGMMLITSILLITCISCSTHKPSSNLLYQRLGGYYGLESITDDFLQLISQDERIVAHFKETDISVFKQRLIEHLCVVSGGECDYQGENMFDAHQGLNITQADFDAVVEHLVAALKQNNISTHTINALLAKLAPLYGDITYH